MMGYKIKNKKGELTTQQIVMLIILITSFVVILFLLFRLNLGETTDKEICHNSIVMKDKSVLGGNLDCKTNYVCISGGKKCENINPSITVKVNPNNKEEIMKAIANEMTDCWWMFGEGEVNYGGGFSSTAVHCAVCSVIKFDEKIQENFETITYGEFYNFLIKPKDKSQTYLNYLYDISDLSLFSSQSQIRVDLANDEISTDKKYSIITGIDNNLGKDEFLKTYLIQLDEMDKKTDCRIFITKA